MSRGVRLLFAAIGIFFVAFGLSCLNYTKASGIEHHREVAAQRRLPQPSDEILVGGAAALILGGGLIGFAAGRKRA